MRDSCGSCLRAVCIQARQRLLELLAEAFIAWCNPKLEIACRVLFSGAIITARLRGTVGLITARITARGRYPPFLPKIAYVFKAGPLRGRDPAYVHEAKCPLLHNKQNFAPKLIARSFAG